MDWEQWLRMAATPPSDHEDSKRQATEQQIHEALDNHSPLRGRPYRIYVKGSYANNTNVRLDYDVDIAVEYYGHIYFDFNFDAADSTPADAGITTPSTDTYTNDQFKADIHAALENAFGQSAGSAPGSPVSIRELHIRAKDSVRRRSGAVSIRRRAAQTGSLLRLRLPWVSRMTRWRTPVSMPLAKATQMVPISELAHGPGVEVVKLPRLSESMRADRSRRPFAEYARKQPPGGSCSKPLELPSPLIPACDDVPTVSYQDAAGRPATH
jgi:hypothetical protein